MVTCPTDSAIYEEEIRTFTFRGIDGITIPKIVRQEAYELAIDIIIRSISREVYKNYECMPPESYFGAATIVSQDALELKIPVKFPRQRIYYGRVPEAFIQWNELINFEYHRSLVRDLAAGTTVNLGIALGYEVAPPTLCCSMPAPVWRELSIREAYFHPPIGTQWEFEITWVRPVAFSDFCETFYDGYSHQTDGDKDSGLPPNGIFPNIAEDPNDPYSGLPAVTPDSVQLGFSNSKSANLADQDPESEIDYGSLRYYVLVAVQDYPFGCEAGLKSAVFLNPNSFVENPNVTTDLVSSYPSCFGVTGYDTKFFADGVQIGRANHIGTLNLTVVRRDSPPTDLTSDWA